MLGDAVPAVPESDRASGHWPAESLQRRAALRAS